MTCGPQKHAWLQIIKSVLQGNLGLMIRGRLKVPGMQIQGEFKGPVGHLQGEFKGPGVHVQEEFEGPGVHIHGEFKGPGVAWQSILWLLSILHLFFDFALSLKSY